MQNEKKKQACYCGALILVFVVLVTILFYFMTSSVLVYTVDEDGEQYYTNITCSDILPGQVISERVSVQNTGHNPTKVKLTIEMDCADIWLDAMGDASIEDLFDIDTDLWEIEDAEINEENNTLTLNCTLIQPLVVGETVELFATVTIPTWFDNDDMQKLNCFHINISSKSCSVYQYTKICDINSIP